MPRKVNPKKCACGCGQWTRGGTWVSGHDRRLEAAIIRHVAGPDGTILHLKVWVELVTGKRVTIDQ